MLTPNGRPYALRPYLSVELDRNSHLDKILPQTTKQVKTKSTHQAKKSVNRKNTYDKISHKIFKLFSQKALILRFIVAVNGLDLNFKMQIRPLRSKHAKFAPKHSLLAMPYLTQIFP